MARYSKTAYVEIATVLRFLYDAQPSTPTREQVATGFADMFERDNPAFEKARFMHNVGCRHSVAQQVIPAAG